MIWGGVGIGALLLILMLLIFQPWQSFVGGPEAAFNQLKRGILNNHYAALYDVVSENGKKKLDRIPDQLVEMFLEFDMGDKVAELEGLKGRARFLKAYEIAKRFAEENGTATAQQMGLTASQRTTLKKTTIKKVEYSEDGTRATLILDIPGNGAENPLLMLGNQGNFSAGTQMRLVKESGGWKIEL